MRMKMKHHQQTFNRLQHSMIFNN